MKALLSRNQVIIFISVALGIILGIYFYALLQARMDLNIQNDGFKLTAAQFLVIAMHPVITAFAWILTPVGAYILLEKGKNQN